MHVHILGICGTFMGSLALLARELGHTVTGSDQNVYPPMSTQLEQAGITLCQGYHAEHLQPHPDVVVIGNALSRGNPAVEYVLNQGLDYISGPEYLARHVLPGRWTLAVSGTHGKTTTTAMLAWVLDQAGLVPGFLIGGVPQGFDGSARLGATPFFVVEADEYDSAFFDKRSKFVHYRPRTAIVNNLEFDHADIFADLAAIQTQFHHLIRTVPGNGLVIAPHDVAAVDAMLARGCWTPCQSFGLEGGDWQARLHTPDGSDFEVMIDGQTARVRWSMTGRHNVLNALATMAAARHVGVTPAVAAEALSCFPGVKRRLELLADVDGVCVYDDFAHHPTAIATTLEGLRQRVGKAPIIALIEPRSNTMKMGAHRDQLLPSAELADHVLWANLADMDWLDTLVPKAHPVHGLAHSVDELIQRALAQVHGPAHIVLMSNGGFGGIHARLVAQLNARRKA